MEDYKEHKVFNMFNRKGIIITYVVVILIILFISAMLIGITTSEKEIQDIAYDEKSNIDYKVYLKENEFFDKNYLEEDNQYIASLIDYVEANFVYELSTLEKGVKYNYTYKVLAEVSVEDTKTKNSLYEYKEELIEEKKNTANTNLKLILRQPIKIDYNKYNNLINKFIEIYDLVDYDANVTINMYVNILDEKGEASNKTMPVMTLKIPLTTKTMAIDIESKEVNATNPSTSSAIDRRGYIFISIVLLMVDFVIIRKLIIFIKDTKDEEAIYNMKLRKIMISYGSYVQKLNSEFNFKGYQIVDIKLFEDLLQIRETINKPILMAEEDDPMETYFFIPAHETVYMYEIKPGTFKEKIENKRKNKKEEKEEITI